MKFEAAYKQIEDVKGWMPTEDCRRLYNRAQDVVDGLIVEIGSFMGRSTKMLALGSPTSGVVSIDPYETVHTSSGLTDPEYVMEQCQELMKGDNWQLIRKKSQEVGETWTEPIDLLVIDGDHHKKALRKDVELFVPHVKKGSWVMFHDYNVGGDIEENGAFVENVVHEVFETHFDMLVSDPQIHGFAICRKK